MDKRIQLSDHFTYGKLARFVFPTAIMMVFTSVYGVVDGLFVSNFTGKIPFAAINLIFPLIMILGAVGFMIGTGGAAIIGKTLGEGKPDKANEYFSLLIHVTLIGGILITAAGLLVLPQTAVLLGAEGEMLRCSVLYGRIVLLGLPFFMLQFAFQTFFVTAEKPKLGLIVTVVAGCTNMALDALFIAGLHWGLAGAAAATALSQFVGGLLPILYFARKNDSLLRITKTRFYGRILLKTCTNGCSELMSNIAASIVTVLYNFQLLRLSGEDGVAAYGVIMYVAWLFIAIFFGYVIGSSPLISYQYGAKNHTELQNLFRKSMRIVLFLGTSMLILSLAVAKPVSKFFVGYDPALLEMTVHGMRIYSVSFLICGFNIFGSGFFTALNNGGISAAISFLRTLVFEVGSVLVLPFFLGMDGIWLAIIVAESGALAVTTLFLVTKRKKYHYI